MLMLLLLISIIIVNGNYYYYDLIKKIYIFTFFLLVHDMGGAREGLAGAPATPRKTKAPL